MAMLYGAGSQRVRLDELLAGYGDGDFLRNEIDENDDDDDDNYEQLDDALRELQGDDDFTSDDEDFLSEDEDEPASQFPAVATAVPNRITTQSLQRYRKNGPFGKLHNIGAHLRRSSQLKQLFYEAQRSVSGDRPLAWVQNVATRWSSDYAMAARALVLRRPLNRFFSDIKERWVNEGSAFSQKPEILQYKLTPSEWQVVSLLQLILK
jgi:hypothetical protein